MAEAVLKTSGATDDTVLALGLVEGTGLLS